MEAPSAVEIALVRTVFDELVEAWVRWGRPAPASVSRARAILDRAMSSAMSSERQEGGSGEAEFDSESDSGFDSVNIGSREAAELLKVNRRTVQRRAEALGGQRVSGSWVFDRDEIGAERG